MSEELIWGSFIATEFPAAPGKQLTLLQSVGVRGGGTPAPTEIGEPRSIKFSSPTNALLLPSRQGQGPFARVTVAGLEGHLVVSKNAWSDTTLAKVTVELVEDSATWPKPFYRKRVPLNACPLLMAAVPALGTTRSTFDGTVRNCRSNRADVRGSAIAESADTDACPQSHRGARHGCALVNSYDGSHRWGASSGRCD